MQMMMAAGTARTISAVTRLGVAEVLQKHGPLTARALTEAHGIAARPLSEVLRAGQRPPEPLTITSVTVTNPRSGESLVESAPV